MNTFNSNWDGVPRKISPYTPSQLPEANSRYPMSPIGTPATPAKAKVNDTSNSEANAKTFYEILCQQTGRTGMVFRQMSAGHPMHFLQMETIPAKSHNKNGETEQSWYVFFEMKNFHGGLADKTMAGRGTFVRHNNGAYWTDMMFAVQDVSMARTKWETLRKTAIWDKTMAAGRI